MPAVRPWPEVPPESEWAIELLEDRMQSTRSPDELCARAAELRAKAAATDIQGSREAWLALADRYEAAAAERVAPG